MGPFPFIGFNQAEITGYFGDEFTYRKNQLQDLIDLFIVDYFVGLKIFVAENQVKEQVIIKNAAPYFAGLQVTFPNPRPSNTGAFSYSFRIKNNQTDSSYFNVVLDGTDGVVTSSLSDPYLGVDEIDSAINRPFINEELKIAKTLSVYNQNGAAIFPDTFTFNQSTGIAERRLLRAYDWSFNQTTNQPQRDAISDLRVIPKTVFQLRELSAIEKAMVSFFLEKPIKESITNDDWNDTNIYLTPLPEGWTFSFISHSSVQKQLAVVKENQIALILAGRKESGQWYFQRFIDPFYTTGALPNIAAILMGTLPASPNNGKLYNPGSSINFYDYDQCEFGTVENEESFNLTIKSGDSYQINILNEFIFEPEIGPESSQFPRIGIFDCNGTYLQDIGSLVSPFNKTLQWNIAADGSGGYYAITSLMSNIDSLNLDIILYGGNEQYFGITELITIPNASINTGSTEFVFANSIRDYLNSQGFTSYWASTVISGGTVIQFFTTVPSIQENGIIAFTSNADPISIAVFGITATQYQASVTIPPLVNSNYFIGIFQSYIDEGDNYSSLLAISQPLQLDNFETFTQILEYGASENSVIEGFEYINGWLQKVRVPLNGAGQTANSEESIYRNSDGTFQIPQNSTDEVLYLHTDYLDLETQRAMISTTKHPIFVLASQNLSVQGDLEITNTQDFTQNSSFRKLQQMRFQALTQGYQPDNNSCIS
jgi:hypothetical protein